MENIRVGVIGLGGRGEEILKNVLLKMNGIEVCAVCDVYPDRCENAVKLAEKAEKTPPSFYTSYRQMLQGEKLDAIYIATSWQTHLEISIACMNAGIAVASEVSCAYSLDECWELVKTYEKTRTPIMMMENCCYGRDELMVMNMIKKGVFGEIVHCDGGYCHDLRDEVAFGREKRHYRLDNYLKRNCENYPTHELGPIAQILNVNRGNRMMTLTSISSKAAGLNQFINDKKSDDETLLNARFNQGDIVTTVIKCANGETIRLTLDTTLPRAYSRGFTIHGTKALFTEDNQSIFIDGVHNEYDFKWHEQYKNVEQYREEHEHPVWQKFLHDGVQGGHGGMDWLQFEDFFHRLRNKMPMQIDVYDMASWIMVSLLSEESIALGGHPVVMPDFTNGKWMTRR